MAEDEDTTREKVLSLSDDLGTESPGIMACHRLNHKTENSKIIVRFSDIRNRNTWLKNSKKLKGRNIFLSPDIPMELREPMNELLKLRKELPEQKRAKSFIKHLQSWPFMQLNVKGSPPIHHSFKKEDLITKLSK